MTFTTGIALFISAALLTISLITLSNILFFPRLKTRDIRETPPVSVLIPARNESAVIAQTVRALLIQDYPNFEIRVLDDHSTDGTGDILRETDDPRLTVLSGEPLPDGWMGKNWACHQLQQTAQGDILIFTDADVQWSPSALRAVIGAMQATDADLFTVWPTQITQTWAERLTVSLMSLVVIGYLPVIGTHHVTLGVFGAANGQCMVWKRAAYHTVGGHEAMRDNVLEDVTMARRVKAAGLRLRMADGNGLIACRMYTDWPSVRDGYAKNILAGYGNSIPVLLLATVFHLLLFIYPYFWLVLGDQPLWALALIALGLSIRAVTARFTRQRAVDALLMPVSVLLMTRITAQAIHWQRRYGGPQWKGRVIRRTSSTQRKSP